MVSADTSISAPRRQIGAWLTAAALVLGGGGLIASSGPAFAAPADSSTIGRIGGLVVNGNAAHLWGFAVDRTHPFKHPQVTLRVDGRLWNRKPTSEPRPEVAQTYHVGRRTGYSFYPTLGNGQHQLCVTARDLDTARVVPLGCRTVNVAARNIAIAKLARQFVGDRYVEGGASPSGFDCSGLTMYVYRRAAGIGLPHNAQAQANRAHRIPRGQARPGDLIFFHDGGGYVYHVGIFEGGNMMVAAATPQDGVRYQSIWSPAVTFGTYTH